VGIFADVAGIQVNMTGASKRDQDLSGLCSEVNLLQRQNTENEQKIESLTTVAIKMAKTVDTLYDSYTDLQRRSMGNNLVLYNLEETFQADLISQCKKKLAEHGANPACLDIERAHRTGHFSGAPRQVIARFNRQEHVTHILEHVRPPPGNRFDPTAIRVSTQVPTSVRYAKAKAHDRMKMEKYNYPDDYVMVRGQKLYIDEDEIEEKVQPISIQEKLRMSKTDKLKASKLLFHKSKVIEEKESEFRIYCTQTQTIEQAKEAYKAISLDPYASACTHLISAYWLESGEEGYTDDKDHGLGKHLLRLMQNAEMSNAICFLTRDYGGVHLGYRRYEIISELLDDIFEKVTNKLEAPTTLLIYRTKVTNKGIYKDIYKEMEE
jgi:hypothetical protein